MEQEVEIWQPPGQDQPRGPGEDPVDATPVDATDPEDGEDAQVRWWTTERLRGLVNSLQPYVDGTFGSVSTKHATQYLSALRELNRLWAAQYRKPPPPPPEPDPVEEELVRTEAAQLVRNRVLEQLDELRSRSRS